MTDKAPYEIKEYSASEHKTIAVEAIREVPLTIYLNDREVVTLLCTGKYPRHLAVGFLKSDALITDPAQLLEVDITDDKERITAKVTVSHNPWAEGRTIQRSITSGCGKGTNFDRNVATISKRRVVSDLRVSPGQILALAGELKERSTLYGRTRGCHNSSLCTPREMLLFREDIGRHNAIDMIVGECFLEGIPTEDKMIVSTGRVASEILLKTVRIGVSVLASTAVATSFSVQLARTIGLTLIGNIKADSFWVYNDPGRIVQD
jgi:FdhD protein